MKLQGAAATYGASRHRRPVTIRRGGTAGVLSVRPADGVTEGGLAEEKEASFPIEDSRA